MRKKLTYEPTIQKVSFWDETQPNPTQPHQCTHLDGWCTDECTFFVRSCPCANQGGYHRLNIFFLFLSPFGIFLVFFGQTLFLFLFLFLPPLSPRSHLPMHRKKKPTLSRTYLLSSQLPTYLPIYLHSHPPSVYQRLLSLGTA